MALKSRMILRLVGGADALLGFLAPAARSARPDLLAVALHAVAHTPQQLGSDILDPFQPFTLEDLAATVAFLRRNGRRFITGRMLAEGTAPAGPLAWITFDDGYANNLKAFELLRREGVPATVFIATDPVERGRAYWWDALWRTARARGDAPEAIIRMREELKTRTPNEIEARIERDFGPGAFVPTGELDRPMTIAEVRQLSREPLVEIGNHTHQHGFLPHLDDATVSEDIAACQLRLQRWTGQAPVSIAYPNGGHDIRAAAAAEKHGLRIGVTCHPARQPLPVPRGTRMEVPRDAGLRRGQVALRLAMRESRLGLTADHPPRSAGTGESSQ